MADPREHGYADAGRLDKASSTSTVGILSLHCCSGAGILNHTITRETVDHGISVDNAAIGSKYTNRTSIQEMPGYVEVRWHLTGARRHGDPSSVNMRSAAESVHEAIFTCRYILKPDFVYSNFPSMVLFTIM